MKRGTRVFILKKALELLLTLLIVTMISFILMQLSPIDAAEAYARRNAFAITPESLATLREQMGLNDPLPIQYWNWVKDAVHLDFGTSYTNGRDVFQEVTQAFSITATIVLLTAVGAGCGKPGCRMRLLLDPKELGWQADGLYLHRRNIDSLLLLCHLVLGRLCRPATVDQCGREHRPDAVSACRSLSVRQRYGFFRSTPGGWRPKRHE